MFHDDDEDFNNLPVKPRGKSNVSPNIPPNDELFSNIPDEDPFNNVKISGSEKQCESDKDSFIELPIIRRGDKVPVCPILADKNEQFKPNPENEELTAENDVEIKTSETKVADITEDVVSNRPPKKGVNFDMNLYNSDRATMETNSMLNASDSGVIVTPQDFGEEFDNAFQTKADDFLNELSFLENCGENDTEAASRQAELARKSLYVRFDPLLSNSPAAEVKEKLQVDNGTSNFDNQDHEATQEVIQVPTKKDNQFPQIDIERISGVESKSSVEPLLYTQSDLDEVVRGREEKWNKKYTELESKVKEEIAMRDLLEQDHREKMECLKKENIAMKEEHIAMVDVVKQYEQMIVQVTENSNNDTLSETVRAKEQLQKELHTSETNLVDAYKRIVTLKDAIDTYQSNQEALLSSVNDFQVKLKKSEERYKRLKEHATEKIESANIEINKVRKKKEIDLAGLEAALKKAQSKIKSLEKEVEQKVQENADYAQICDELINKVSGE